MSAQDKWWWLHRQHRLYVLWARMVDRCRDKGWTELREKRATALERAMVEADRQVEASALAGFHATADFRRDAGLIR